ncbi:Putative Myb/SANT-like domain-containing protein [Colletotrichum destructivum]|uniref:Myb/SANT-like domain-containing protein n=1 Tax=Colletotrichum destructivum TaxID=34406 RepID=A0AAX4ICT6_9PEZI|nr:Putative Myb/SANT-like domain-containing protein [Colletotrichum destructivum]
MSDDEFTGPDGPPGSAGGDRDKRAPRFSWTPAYETTFFRSLCDSVQLGLRENHSFKADAWDRAATALREKHSAYPTKSHLVNKSDNARKKFRLWRGLREDPEFLYNPTNRTVTASEEAWKAHIEKEPLSRALRGRPFDHEQFMEILYPDVIGSGGAPKRIMKPKRKGPDVIQGSEDPDMPGTAVLDLQVEPPYRPPSQSGVNQQAQPRGSVSQSPVAQTQQPMIPQQQKQQQQQQQQQQPPPPQQRPTSTAIPPRTHIAGTSALTPPEETATGRKRFPQQTPTSDSGGGGKAPTAPMGPPTQPAEKRRRVSGYTNPAHASGSNALSSHGNDASSASMASAGKQLMEDGLIKIADALRGRSPPRWPEQAIDIFFRDFSDEDMDLQLKIAEKALADDNKAMIFCKMSPALRKHWVKRLRELHNNSRNT